jgi:hypothetical protein
VGAVVVDDSCFYFYCLYQDELLLGGRPRRPFTLYLRVYV